MNSLSSKFDLSVLTHPAQPGSAAWYMTHYLAFGSRNLPICFVNYYCNNQYVLVLCTHAGVCTLCIDLNLEPCVHMCVLKFSALCIVQLYHCTNSNCATLVLYISASIALLYVQLSFRG
jgi:hypothetical protein